MFAEAKDLIQICSQYFLFKTVLMQMWRTDIGGSRWRRIALSLERFSVKETGANTNLINTVDYHCKASNIYQAVTQNITVPDF